MLEKHFILAGEGKECWHQLDEKYIADRYILFPHKNDSYNYYALLHLEEYVKKCNAKTIVILSSESVIFDAIPYFTSLNVMCHMLTDHDIDAIIKYYALYEFTSRLTIISLTRPYDTCGENLIGVKGVTKEDLLCFDIYRFSETPKKEHPLYSGNDTKLMDFMRLGDGL